MVENIELYARDGERRHSPRASPALQKLVEQDPAFGALSLWCAHRDGLADATLVFRREQERWSITPTVTEPAPAWTDGSTIYYGSRFLEWSLEEQVAVCAHELLHVALRHVPRAMALAERSGRGFRADLYNIATDAIINQTLIAAGYTLPRPCVVLCELLAEVWEEKVAPDAALSRWEAEALYARLMEHASIEGNDWPVELENYLSVHAVDRDMAIGASTAVNPAEELEWQGRFERAMAIGRGAGRGLGVLGLKLADLPRSRVPWEVLLRRTIARAVAGQLRPDWSRPARTWLARQEDARRGGRADVPFEPRVARLMERKRVAVGIDVSGSISTAQLRRFAGEIAGIGKRTGAELHVLVFDEMVRSETQLSGVDLVSEVLALSFARGGGTSFVDVLNRAAELDPSVIVVLTDLLGPFSDAPPSTPVIWCVPDGRGAQASAPFGRIITM